MTEIEGSTAPAAESQNETEEIIYPTDDLEQPPNPTDVIDVYPTDEDPTGGDAQPPHQSPTLLAIDESRHPAPEVACASCPTSTWFLSGTELQCYCRTMYLLTWTTSRPGQITACDGPTAMQ